MKPPPTRLIRRGLLAVLLIVAGAVAWNLHRPSGVPPERSTAVPPAADGTSIGDLSFFRFHGGEQKVQVQARTMSGEEGGAMRLEGVEIRFPFTSRGEDSAATVTADECLYDASRESARFRGNVHVVTDDGVELDTERLDYEGGEGRASTEEPVRFRRGRASGSARGLEYRGEADELELKSEVRLLFEDPRDGPSTEIQARWARASRRTRIVEFRGDVVVEQSGRDLRSNRLEVTLDPELEMIVRVVAIGSVDLRLAGEGALPGDVRGGGGERRLQCRRLDLDFRGPGVLEEALAAQRATLDLLPGAGDPPETRRIAAHVLRFLFDEQGRLQELRGGGAAGRARGRRGMAVLTAEPLGPGPGGPKRVECARFTAHFVSETGRLEGAELQDAVTFTEPGRQAWSQKAVYEEGAGRLTLTGGAPRVRDEAEGSELEAETIVLGTTGGGLTADGGVRHTIARRTAEAEGGLLGGSEPTVLVSRHFEYEPSSKTARYRDGALLRSGRDEIRAPLIVLEEAVPDARRLTASGGASSLLHPRPEEGATREPAPVATRSREMVYDEQADRVVYTGDVEIRQGDIVTLSPEAVVTLTASGDAVLKIVAGEPVEVHQGTRRATGRTGTYSPASETLVLVGDEVVLQDEDRRVTGRVLTFQVGDDRIRIDGREETRTEAVFSKREAPPP